MYSQEKRITRLTVNFTSNSQVSVDFSKVPRIPGDGAYATSDEDIEAHPGTKIHNTPAAKLKPLHFDAVVPEMFQKKGNTLSPSIINHGATPSVDFTKNNAGSISSSNHLPTEGQVKEGESVSVRVSGAGIATQSVLALLMSRQANHQHEAPNLFLSFADKSNVSLNISTAVYTS